MNRMYIGGKWIGGARRGDASRDRPGRRPAVRARSRAVARTRSTWPSAAARAALGGAWGRMSATERGQVMLRISQRVLDNAEPLAQLEARDTGKPMTTARNDIKVLARYFEFYGGAADKVHGEVIPFLHGLRSDAAARAAGRHRAHHPVELPGADARPHRSRRRSPWATPRCSSPPRTRACRRCASPSSRRGGAAGGRAQRRHRPRRGGRRRARRASGHRLHHLHRLERGRHADPAGRGERTRSSACSSSAASRRRSCSPMPTSSAPLPIIVRAIIAERGPDLHRRQPPAGAAGHLRQLRRPRGRSVRQGARRHAARWISTAGR